LIIFSFSNINSRSCS